MMNSSYSELWQSIYDLATQPDWDHIRTLPSVYARWWVSLAKANPEHVFVETSLVLVILYLAFIRKTGRTARKIDTKLSKAEIDQLVDEWQPEPLVPEVSEVDRELAENPVVINAFEGAQLIVEGLESPVINFGTFDFLDLGSSKESKDASRAALTEYGCGSCGPRGFYGSIKPHLDIEEAIANFMRMPAAITYSDAASTLNSVLPAFSKKGDFIIADEAVQESLVTGLQLTRSTVRFFKHNDMADLARILEEKARSDKAKGRRPADQRRFLVAEGLYRNRGTLCPLPELMALKEKYYYRLILDESYSFGALGATGRGITEHYGMDPNQVEAIVVSMETSLASVGGLCVGGSDVIDHQRLSGAGYCFSAAAPPFMSSAALAALRVMEAAPERLQRLQSNAAAFHAAASREPGVRVTSAPASPVHYLSPAGAAGGEGAADEGEAEEGDDAASAAAAAAEAAAEARLRAAARALLRRGFAVAVARGGRAAPPGTHAAAPGRRPGPALRVAVHAGHAPRHLAALAAAAGEELRRAAAAAAGEGGTAGGSGAAAAAPGARARGGGEGGRRRSPRLGDQWR